jgi:hypothetical protein
MANLADAPRQSRTTSKRSAKGSDEAMTGREAAAPQAETVVVTAETDQMETETMPPEAETNVDQPETPAPQAEISSQPAGTGQAQAAPPKDVRFRIFVIDTGWNSVASRVLHENLNVIRDLNCDDEVYLLDRDMSIALLRHHPAQVGRDPIITVHDTQAIHRHRVHHTHGFRLHLGILDSEDQVLAALQMFTRFLATHRTAKDLEKVVRKNLHRQGFVGAIEILGGAEHKKMIE